MLTRTEFINEIELGEEETDSKTMKGPTPIRYDDSPLAGL